MKNKLNNIIGGLSALFDNLYFLLVLSAVPLILSYFVPEWGDFTFRLLLWGIFLTFLGFYSYRFRSSKPGDALVLTGFVFIITALIKHFIVPLWPF
ncbi:hypothetical protein [Gimesia fumaroli]|uniref:Uncharacterized protein n=1 Tax=Gimesia fumaroli TaxID=2527976 RepID=A0A518II70_9PLAN|nr:hypothetical protein [Gimesia fumaroli]QDV52792.1 hypothetical protein Enr17x_48600 [Gimesia fumaroli]